MLALYILGGIVTYLGIGTKAAHMTIDHYADKGYKRSKISEQAQLALFLWPWWLVVDAPNILFKKRIKRVQLETKQRKQQEKEVEQYLLEAGL